MQITLIVQGHGNVPSFKTGKRGVFDKTASGKVFARPVTKSTHKKWMKSVILSFASQLRYDSVMTENGMATAVPLQSLIALLPHDDCWQAIPILAITSQKCQPGAEGATITIERL